MKLAIMQPYFLPYIGYFQLINSVDEFVIYDNIKYTKKGWINRNRIVLNGKDTIFSLPLKKDSDMLHVMQRELAENFNRLKLQNQFKEAYRNAPYFSSTVPLLDSIINFNESNLFLYIYHSITAICKHLNIKTKICTSSSISINHDLRGQDKVLAICHQMRSTSYINPIGGIELYDRDIFASQGIELKFIKTKEFIYPQFQHDFLPFLSIIDVLMFNHPEIVQKYICENYHLY